jgi:hypothetical protein
MTALLRFKSCAVALAGFVLSLVIEEDRPAHAGESLDYRGPQRRDDENGWFIG